MPPSRIPELKKILKLVDDPIITSAESMDLASTVELDPHQEFAIRISNEREEMRERELSQAVVRSSKPLRMILTGTAGSGKSLTIRAQVLGRRRALKERLGVRKDLKLKDPEQDAIRGACLLAAPTGCASFHMKFGATTVHRAYGIPIGSLCPANRQADYFIKRQARLKAASLFILDEMSMLSRMMLGKLVYRVEEALGRSTSQSLGGKDCILAGDMRQIPPIDGEPLYRQGPYTGNAVNAGDGAPTAASLVERGVLLRDEFIDMDDGDVVILRQVHRIETHTDGLDPEAAAKYKADADRFLQVLDRMANCTWDQEDHAWLSKRNKSELAKTEEGLKEIAEFAET